MQRNVLCLLSSGKIIEATSHYRLTNQTDFHHGLLADANKYLGGPYEFMGVAVRAGERQQRLDEMRRLARALEKGLTDTRRLSTEEAVDALPKVLIAGSTHRAQLISVLERYKRSLYPPDAKINTAAANRVVDAHKSAGLLAPSIDVAGLLDLSVIDR